MTISEFNFLTLDQKCQILEKHGMNIFWRIEGNSNFNLYAIFSFYAEMCYNFNNESLEDIVAFKNSKYLEPYIDEIVLDINLF